MGWKDTSENRNSRRVSAELSVKFSIIEDQEHSAAVQRTKTTDISASGLAFVSETAIPISARLKMAVYLPGDEGVLESEAIVVRIVRELPAGKGHEYGVKFDMESITDEAKLSTFVSAIDIVPLLESMIKHDATSMHLSGYTPPVYRVKRKLTQFHTDPLSPETVETLVLGTFSSERKERFETDKEIEFLFTIPAVGRWRVSALHQRGNIEATFHKIDTYVATLVDLGLPDSVRGIALNDSGLVIVSGAPETGKTSTLAAMIDFINRESTRIIVTLEEAIEKTHDNHLSLVRQREVGSDTNSYRNGFKSAIRQDADVIVVDNLDDPEIMDMALHAAETGCLVIGAMPTLRPLETITRILAMYPKNRYRQILQLLSSTLRGIVCQKLLASTDPGGLCLVAEVMPVDERIRAVIRAGLIENIKGLIGIVPGGQPLDVSLRNLVITGKIDIETAALLADDADNLNKYVNERTG